MPVQRNVNCTRFCSWKCQKNKPIGLSTFWTHAITWPLDWLHTVLISDLLNLLELKRNVLLRTVIKGKKLKWSRYRPGVAHRVGRGIALLFHDRGTRRGWVVCSTPGPRFTPRKSRYPFCRRLGGPQGLSGRAENLVPIGIRSRTVQPVISRYTDWATRPRITYSNMGVKFSLNRVRRLTHEEIHWVTDWHMRTNEETYYNKNGVVSDIIDKRGFKLKK